MSFRSGAAAEEPAVCPQRHNSGSPPRPVWRGHSCPRDRRNLNHRQAGCPPFRPPHLTLPQPLRLSKGGLPQSPAAPDFRSRLRPKTKPVRRRLRFPLTLTSHAPNPPSRPTTPRPEPEISLVAPEGPPRPESGIPADLRPKL